MAFFYAPGRGGGHAVGFLKGFQGKLHVDGYSGYNAVAAPGKGVVRCFCWAHARRKLREIHDSHRSPVAAEGLRRIAAMYAIEKEVRGEPPGVRLAVRRARTAPLVEDFGVWLRRQRARVSPKSRLGEKLAYIGNHWEGLKAFLPRRARGDGQQRRGERHPAACAEPQERPCSLATTKEPCPGPASPHWWKRPK